MILEVLEILASFQIYALTGLEALFAEDHVALLEADLIIFSSLTPTIMTMGLSNVMQMSTRKLQQAASWAESLGQSFFARPFSTSFVKCPRRTEHCQVGPNCFRNAHLLETCTKSCHRKPHIPQVPQIISCERHRATAATHWPTELQQLPTPGLYRDRIGTGSVWSVTPGLVSSRAIQNVPSTFAHPGPGNQDMEKD